MTEKGDAKEEKKEKEKKPAKQKENKKTKQEGSAKETKKPTAPVSENFKYIVTIHDTDIDGNLPLLYAIHQIDGIGMRVAQAIVNKVKIPYNQKIGSLSDTELENLIKQIEGVSSYMPSWMLNRHIDPETNTSYHLIGEDVKIKRQEDINLMKMIKCYKGIRHEKGYKVRGQRTKSNGRTGMAAGVTKKALATTAKEQTAQPAAAANENKAKPKAPESNKK